MKGKAAVLMYHNIGIPPKGVGLRGLYVTPRMFRFQMCYLRQAGFSVVPLSEIIASTRGGIPEERLVSLTFDDGYEDFAEHAWPVLKEHHYPSTVFVVSDRAGEENVWDRDSLGIGKRLMGWDRIRELQGGVTFGSHSRTHPFLCRLSDQELDAEITGSKEIIEEKLQYPVDYFCYPYGDYDSRVKKAVIKAGYYGAVTTKRGLLHQGDDPYELRRTLVRYSTNPFLFFYKLSTGYEDRKSGRA